MPPFLARREELRGRKCLVFSQAEQGRSRSAECLQIMGSLGPSEGATGKRDADITSEKLDSWVGRLSLKESVGN